ncbi:MAG TPA: replication-associated recombination protein A [Solirubrobacteraceae bacterium]|jgi:putative ATPase|nr:replication-associated recombination protein A [Solirubrobacteraceae bacterium]
MDTLFEPLEPSEPRRTRNRPTAAGNSPRASADAKDDPNGGAAHTQEARPLAARVRPLHLEEFVGQAHLLGEGSGLRTAIEQGHPHSMVLYGPPGSGKTTLARMVAERSRAVFEELSAVQAGRAEVRAVLERAAHRRATRDTGTVFFLDEIHRFNKAQQDTLLPAVEEGVVTLIGATTENPAFEVNGALLSRMRVYALRALSAEEVGAVLRRALASGELMAVLAEGDGGAVAGADGDGGAATGADGDGGAATDGDGEAGTAVEREGAAIAVAPETLDFLAARAEGDARTALNALELAVTTAAELGETSVEIARAEDALQQRAVLYDRKGDRHYDYISAWIKATRGSDPDASLYYLAVMLEGGEDPRFIVRRMVILASEDIGNADPAALGVAVAAAQAVEHVGMPEAKFALAQAAIYLSLAPKSNMAGRALGAAQRHVREQGAAPVPGWLRSGPRPGQEVGGYDYPHAHPGHISPQELLPEEVAGARFYEPDEAEAALAERLAQVRRARGR